MSSTLALVPFLPHLHSAVVLQLSLVQPAANTATNPFMLVSRRLTSCGRRSRKTHVVEALHERQEAAVTRVLDGELHGVLTRQQRRQLNGTELVLRLARQLKHQSEAPHDNDNWLTFWSISEMFQSVVLYGGKNSVHGQPNSRQTS